MGAFHEYNMPLKRDLSKHTLHKWCRVSTQIVHPWGKRNAAGMTKLVVSQESLPQGGYIICVDTFFYQRHNFERY